MTNLPPDVQNTTLRDVFSKYGDVKRVTEETWSKFKRHPVSNGHTSDRDKCQKTYAFTQSTNIVRGTMHNLL